MAELDKKIQKSQADLVQSVLEAYEKKNQERVDMLVTNAIKQLKMSRFKPDQTTCLSLTYLARINSKVFMQSSAIKEVLKSLLRRDNGPTNIKGVGKSDIMLPVMAANILLACCDSTDVRAIILNKIEQWLSSSQKIAEIVQHLLAVICLKSQNDQQTIRTLLDMRQHWLQYLDENFTNYGQVPSDLCASVRKLLQTESSCESLLSYLGFLIKHDRDIESLSHDLSKFIINRPISIDSMLKTDQAGVELNKILLRIYIKLIAHLKSPEAVIDREKSKQPTIPVAEKDDRAKDVTVKMETDDVEMKCEDKSEVKSDPSKPRNGSKKEAAKSESTEDNQENETLNQQRLVPSLYVRFIDCTKLVRLDKSTIEAVFTLLAMVSSIEECSEDFDELMSCWLCDKKAAVIFEDLAGSSLYNMPYKLRQKLIHSSSEPLIDLSLLGASTTQLLMLLQQFGLPAQTINSILKKIEDIKDVDQIRSEIKDTNYFSQLMEFYTTIRCQSAKDLLKRLELTV